MANYYNPLTILQIKSKLPHLFNISFSNAKVCRHTYGYRSQFEKGLVWWNFLVPNNIIMLINK
jgi:hypothetical protein